MKAFHWKVDFLAQTWTWKILISPNYIGVIIKTIFKQPWDLRPFVCLQWFDLRNHSIEPNDNLLEGKDRCPNLNEKSGEQFAFRFVLYLVIFITNVMLVNILIGQISKTLERVMKDDEKDYYMNVLQLKAGFNIGNVCGVWKIIHYINVYYSSTAGFSQKIRV